MLTPFAGTGSECVAAKITGRHYIGFEIDEEYCKISKERLIHSQSENETISLFTSPQEDINVDEAGH